MPLSEDSARTIDVISKLVGIAALVFSALYGVLHYVNDAERESQKPFLDQRLALYLETNETVATITTSNDQKKVQDAKAQFWTLYWGRMAVVENQEVQDAMDSVASCLRRKCTQKEVRVVLPPLIKASRTSIRESWQVVISDDPLKDQGGPVEGETITAK